MMISCITVRFFTRSGFARFSMKVLPFRSLTMNTPPLSPPLFSPMGFTRFQWWAGRVWSSLSFSVFFWTSDLLFRAGDEYMSCPPARRLPPLLSRPAFCIAYINYCGKLIEVFSTVRSFVVVLVQDVRLEGELIGSYIVKSKSEFCWRVQQTESRHRIP